MTVRTPPTFLQAGSHPAENTRLALTSMMGSPLGSFAGGVISNSVADGDPGHGRVLPSDLEVTENGTPDMSVDVAAGACFIRGTESGTQGSYHFVNDATVNLSISAADPTNARWDLVVAQVRDAGYSGSDNDARLFVVEGTPAGSPADPTLPENCLVLARVVVGASVSSITDSDITNFSITPVGYRFAGRVTFTANGTFTKGDYPWLRAVLVKVQAGGGGGAGASTDDEGAAGGGGGGYAESFLASNSLGSTETVTIGAGGAGGAAGANPGAAGGSSSFGTLVVATGGGGGQAQAVGNVNGGTGGSATAGDLVVRGGGGGPNTPFGRAGAHGGDSHLGGGAPGVTRYGATLGAAGNSGQLYGGGGGGAARVTTNQAGGNGAAGIVIVDLYV